MPFNGAGIFSRTPGTRIANQGPLVSAQVNDETDNLVAGINGKVNLDGLLPMLGLQLLFGDGTALLHGATVRQAQNGVLSHATAVGGTVDAIQVTMTPANTTLTLRERLRFTSTGANTIVAPTLSKDGGVTNKTIKKGAGAALAVGDTGAAGYENEVEYNGTDWILLNPVSVAEPIQQKGANVASASTVTFLNDGDYVHITGTTTILDMDFTTARNGKSIRVQFDGILTLTNNATTLVLPGGADIATAAGDTAEFVQDNNDNIKCLWYTRAASAPSGGGLSAGDIKWAAYSATPGGFLPCDGSAVSRTTYAALFTAIATAWGVGDGSTTFNVPDLRGRAAVGAGTGTVAETQAAANFNVSDIITVASNPMDTKPKWLTGMKVRISTSGVLPTGISAATDYWIRRLDATTLSLYTSLALAMNTNSTTGRVDITAVGSGNHTITCTLAARTLADLFGVEVNGDLPFHEHLNNTGSSGSGKNTAASSGSTVNVDTGRGDVNGITNMQPSVVLTAFIKT